MNRINKIINDLKKEAKKILENRISSKDFPIQELCKEINPSNINSNLFYDLCFDDCFQNIQLISKLYESCDSIKDWQDDMSNFSIEQLKFKAVEELKKKYLEKIKKEENFDRLISSVSKLHSKKLHKIFSTKFVKMCALITKLKFIEVDFENLDKEEDVNSGVTGDYTIKIDPSKIDLSQISWPNKINSDPTWQNNNNLTTYQIHYDPNSNTINKMPQTWTYNK